MERQNGGERIEFARKMAEFLGPVVQAYLIAES